MLTPISQFVLPAALTPSSISQFMETFDGYCFNGVFLDHNLENPATVAPAEAAKWSEAVQGINFPIVNNNVNLLFSVLNGRLSSKLSNVLSLDSGPNAGKQLFYTFNRLPALYLGRGVAQNLTNTALVNTSFRTGVFAEYGGESYAYFQAMHSTTYAYRYKINKLDLLNPTYINSIMQPGASLRDFEGRLYFDASTNSSQGPYFFEAGDVAAASGYQQTNGHGLNEPYVLYRGATGIKIAYLHLPQLNWSPTPVVLRDGQSKLIDEFEYTNGAPSGYTNAPYCGTRSFMTRYFDAGADKRFVIVVQWERMQYYDTVTPMPYVMRAYKVVGDTLVRVASETFDNGMTVATLGPDGSFGYFIGSNVVSSFVFDPVSEQFVFSPQLKLKSNSQLYSGSGLLGVGNIDSQGRLWLSNVDRYATVFELARPIAAKVTVSGQTLSVRVSNTRQNVAATVALRLEGGAKFQDGFAYKVVQVPIEGLSLPFTGTIASYDAMILE